MPLPRGRRSALRRVVLVLTSISLVCVCGPATATTTACDPACAVNELCSPEGACVSKCNPPCPAVEICTPDAICVSKCNPPCPGTETCTPDARCVSLCNPPCGLDERCTAEGACVGDVEPPPPPARPPPAPAPSVLVRPPAESDPGWGDTAGWLGVATSIVLVGLTAGAATAEDFGTGLAIGGPAVLVGGVMIPVVAVGAGSARVDGRTGIPALRVASWVAYGIALADAMVLIGLNIAEIDLGGGIVASVGALGTLSCIGMTIDAFVTDAEDPVPGATALGRDGPSLVPSLIVAPDRAHGAVVGIGLRGTL